MTLPAEFSKQVNFIIILHFFLLKSNGIKLYISFHLDDLGRLIKFSTKIMHHITYLNSCFHSKVILKVVMK